LAIEKAFLLVVLTIAVTAVVARAGYLALVDSSRGFIRI